MSSEFACDLACGNVPQDHRLVWAAGTDVAVVIGTGGEKHKTLSAFALKKKTS